MCKDDRQCLLRTPVGQELPTKHAHYCALPPCHWLEDLCLPWCILFRKDVCNVGHTGRADLYSVPQSQHTSSLLGGPRLHKIEEKCLSSCECPKMQKCWIEAWRVNTSCIYVQEALMQSFRFFSQHFIECTTLLFSMGITMGKFQKMSFWPFHELEAC